MHSGLILASRITFVHFTLATVPITPPAPARFSTMKGWPSAAPSSVLKAQATASSAPPAPKGTMMRTGLAGYCCAGAGLEMPKAKLNANAILPRKRMALLVLVCAFISFDISSPVGVASTRSIARYSKGASCCNERILNK